MCGGVRGWPGGVAKGAEEKPSTCGLGMASILIVLNVRDEVTSVYPANLDPLPRLYLHT